MPLCDSSVELSAGAGSTGNTSSSLVLVDAGATSAVDSVDDVAPVLSAPPSFNSFFASLVIARPASINSATDLSEWSTFFFSVSDSVDLFSVLAASVF